MNPPGYDIDHQWNGPRDIFTRQQFAAVIRDATAITVCVPGDNSYYNDSGYQIMFRFKDIIITEFMIATKWVDELEKAGYWYVIKGTQGFYREQSTISDIWTAKVRLCEYLGCTEQEINDIFWNGKSRDLVGCAGCPCNKIEKGAKNE